MPPSSHGLPLQAQPPHPAPARLPAAAGPGRAQRALAAGGEWLRTHARLIRALQWVVVLVYAVLLIVPAVLPLPDRTAHVWNHLTVAAEFAFWGIWWPFVLLSMVLFGRLWCGVLCPEGTLTEWAAKHGRGLGVPRWMRWGGWPFVAFVCTTVYGQMVSVYQYPKAALVVLGGSTVAALVVGYFYTRGKRAWCRYLCPVNGVFGLLSKLAPMHYRVDDEAWRRTLARELDAAPARASASVGVPTAAQPVRIVRRAAPAVDCAPMQPLRHMQGGSGCHMCGRCSGHQDAIALQWRSPAHEVVHVAATEADHWQTWLIVFGLLGVAIGAFHWSASPWFISARQAIATWLVDRDLYWPLADNAPWWLLTHYPDQNDVFTWLDGALLLGYIGATALVWGGVVLALLALAVRLAGPWARQRLHHLAQALIPLAGLGVFLGLSAITLTLLRGEGVFVPWANAARLGLLALANAWSLWLGWAIVRHWGGLGLGLDGRPARAGAAAAPTGSARTLLALAPFVLALAWVDSAWGWLFWWW
ncbi:4Fe-4S binding domain-containing protein [Oryzisolibacter propanilivorax]|uniref:4Fe-4S binding domain-containing protein n=1 Tax=Oryzisolibacter propanilivorax TaxID=1527607 RepID=A0A1G9Q9N2_9BURK|nr:4Fe-4S binding protein [Oryzisolibacter propanilivorax]SDM07441.1 4Fe-4S binding domain-containing protein [Oryzisolibacter propanilivorax]